MRYTPYKHQQLAYDFCVEREKCALFLGMGLGKTVVTLTVLAERLWDEFTVRRCLVIAPKNVAESVWAQETRKWDHLTGLRCSVLSGTPKQRLAALHKDADLYIIGRDNLLWLMDQTKGKLPYDMVVLDELSSFKSTKAKRWKALKKAIQSVRYVIGLTGTPAPNGYHDLWPEIYLLDGGKRLGRTHGEFEARYFVPAAHKGHIVYRWALRLGAKETIDRELRDLCLSMKSEDWLDLPETIYNTIPVTLDAAAMRRYRELEREKVLPLLRKGGKLEPLRIEEVEKMTSAIRADTAASLAGKLLQMANGAVYDDEHGVLPIHEAKLDALEEIIEANEGSNLLVFYAYEHDRDRILARFPQAKAFAGRVDAEAWNRGEIPLLLCHPASMGHGLNLQFGGHIIVWFGLTWSLELYQQANARLPRPGQTERVIIHHIVSTGTLDERVMSVMASKDASQNGLLEALKQYLKEEPK